MDPDIRFGQAASATAIPSPVSDAEGREWLVTNGIGGYASGTVAGSITRGYHGLLVAALRPPVDRRLMCVKLDDTADYRGRSYDLATNRWLSGAVAPDGAVNIQSFALDGSIPTWRYAFGDLLVDKRIWMEHGQNTTWVSWTVVSAGAPLELTARAIVDNRVFHNTGSTAWPASVTTVAGGVEVVSGGDGARPLTLRASAGSQIIKADRYDNFLLPAETRRGLRDSDDHVHAADFTVTLHPGDTWLVLASAEDDPAPGAGALDRRRQRDEQLIGSWEQARSRGTWPAWAPRLVLAADQFIVERRAGDNPDGRSVIAGYHWFEDWGRDTMISLPGLTLTTGQSDAAAEILRTFAKHVSQGMLPNRFPDGSDTPQYNTIDATLWYFQAIRAYHDATGDNQLLRDLWPALQSIVDWHVKGTRFGIGVDPADGLLRGGHPGVQLTWMDAKVGDQVITPRIGKPVEVNALWFNALRVMVGFAEAIGEPAASYADRAEQARLGFQRFWNDAAGYCYDVLDGPGGPETALRPNQLLAVSLPESPLSEEQQRKVLAACGEALLTSHGLRSLSPDDPAYVGRYGGDQASRDGAYHQGTVWAWLLGPYAEAHLRVIGDPEAAMRLLEPLADHLAAAGLGTISEIFDGDAPFAPRGCIAQAWSVGEVLRVLDRVVGTRQQ
jgi:predicted glycogen debranching enzyme